MMKGYCVIMLMLTCKHKSNHCPCRLIKFPNTKRKEKKKCRHKLCLLATWIYRYPVRTDLHYNHVCAAVLSDNLRQIRIWLLKNFYFYYRVKSSHPKNIACYEFPLKQPVWRIMIMIKWNTDWLVGDGSWTTVLHITCFACPTTLFKGMFTLLAFCSADSQGYWSSLWNIKFAVYTRHPLHVCQFWNWESFLFLLLMFLPVFPVKSFFGGVFPLTGYEDL